MKSFLVHHRLLILLVFVVLLAGCKQPETVVVNENPTAVASSDTTYADTSGNKAAFRKLVVGEYNAIPTMDPLLADNGASMRAVQLVFEGLVRLDSDGSVVPGLAKSWEISGDSLTFTFHLRDDIYYQDNDIFSTGTGRKMTSKDVKFVFERMAKVGVPPKAAHLFMGIRGFDPYYQEQHEVYLPKNRTLEGISGIQIPSDTTVVFDLINQDSEFLKKLATPLAVIYPEEALGRTGDTFSAVGAGPFQFSSSSSDSTLIFTKFKNYYAASTIQLSRVDVITSNSESALFRSMSDGNIYMMPQLGPQTLPAVLDSTGRLKEPYVGHYKLNPNNGFSEYVMRYNPAANLSSHNAQKISAISKSGTSNYFNKFPDAMVVAQTSPDGSDPDLPNFSNPILAVFSEDPFIKTYLGSLSKALDQKGATLKMSEIRAPSRNTALFFTHNYPLISDAQWDEYETLFRFRVSQVALQRIEITDLKYNQYPWWFDLRGVTLPAVENLN